MRCAMWFREDLRLHDNTALYHASHAAKDGLIAVYVLDFAAWQQHDVAECRMDFLWRNVQALQKDLRTFNIPLIILASQKSADVPALLLALMQQHKIDCLYYNQQYEIDEVRRDQAVAKSLRQHQIETRSYTDEVWFAPGTILTQAGNYYTVFTPFKKAYLTKLTEVGNSILAVPKTQTKLIADIEMQETTTWEKQFAKLRAMPDLYPAGEIYAQQRLANFIKYKIKNYKHDRDFPDLNGTSVLSPYLAAGVISSRQCLQAALDANHGYFDRGDENILTWISELIWREFYKHILYGFPRVSMSKPFKLETENIVWDNNKLLFQAWCEGNTGYPIIDAAMRQLQQIGWMHNRLRMIVAMFLTKDLLIDWRWGEKFFMQHLIDGDLAANNGGWQWSASTGTDAVPYFRIFNPCSQSKKYDPEGKFIKQYCPELAELEGDELHDPELIPPLFRQKLNYPRPIIEHGKARLRALTIFKNLKS